jgi:hypothetical protein
MAQTYANHRRFVIGYHVVVMPLLLLNVVMMGYGIYLSPASKMAWWHLFAAIGVAGLGILARMMVVTVQDRVILLEMRLRLAEILPAELKARSGELTKSQRIGLRFASDGEMAGLVTRCLSGELKNGEAVKKEIKTWVPDTQRC